MLQTRGKAIRETIWIYFKILSWAESMFLQSLKGSTGAMISPTVFIYVSVSNKDEGCSNSVSPLRIFISPGCIWKLALVQKNYNILLCKLCLKDRMVMWLWKTFNNFTVNPKARTYPLNFSGCVGTYVHGHNYIKSNPVVQLPQTR